MPRVRVEFANTLADVKEAQRTHEGAAILRFRDPRSGMRQPARVTFFWIAFIALTVGFFLYQKQHDATLQSPPPPMQVSNPQWWFNFLVFFVPGVVLLLGIVYLQLFYPRHAAAKRVWDSNPSLQLCRTLDADASRIILEDGQASREMRWSSLVRYLESSNLFLLYTADGAYDIVPKRGFASVGEVDAFRALLDEQIPARS